MLAAARSQRASRSAVRVRQLRGAAVAALAVAARAAGALLPAPPRPYGPCLVVRAASWGLGSQLVQLLHALALVGERDLYLDWSESPYTCCGAGGDEPAACANNGWHALFGAPVPRPAPAVAAPPGAQSTTSWEHDIAPTGSQGNTAQYWQGEMSRARLSDTVAVDDDAGGTRFCARWGLLHVAQRLNEPAHRALTDADTCERLCAPLAAVWQLASPLKEIVAYELDAMRLFPQPLVVLHVRGGDKLEGFIRELTEAYEFAPALAALAQNASLHGGTCVVLGDDYALAQRAGREARKALSCHVHNRVEPRAAHFQPAFNAQPPALRCHRTKRVLADIELMAAAVALVGLTRSNVMRVAALLRRCRGQPGATLDWQLRDALAAACTP
jgi:hypothetical protein